MAHPGKVLCIPSVIKHILCLTLVIYGVHVSLWAQKSSFQLQTNVGQTVREVISYLEAEYQIHFSYPSAIGEHLVVQPVNTQTDNLTELLSRFFDPQDIEFKQTGSRTILLRKAQKNLPPTYPLQGLVWDSYSGSPLENASVQLLPNGRGAYTDEMGSFFFEVDQPITDTDTLVIRSLGFAERRIPASDINPNQRIQLEPHALPLREILVVEPLSRLTAVSVYHSMSDQAGKRQLAGGTSQLMGRDIFRQLQLLPGVFTANDKSAALQIRGSSEGETFILLDGMPLYHSDHYYGIFSAIQPEWINTTSIHLNNMPVEYDGRTGGMVILESIDSLSQPTLGSDLNTLTGSIKAGSPLMPGVDFQLGLRSTWQSVTDAPFFSQQASEVAFSELVNPSNTRRALLTLQPAFTFFDVHSRIGIHLGDHQAKLNLYSSADDFANQYTVQFRTRTATGFLENQESLDQSTNWKTNGGSLQYDFRPNRDISFMVEAYATHYQQDAAIEGMLVQSRVRRGEPIRAINFSNERANELEEAGGLVAVQHQNGITAGISLTHPEVVSIIHQDDQTILFNQNNGWVPAFFGEKAWSSQAFTLQMGGRLSYFNVDQRWRVAPRVSAFWSPDTPITVKASGGRHIQYVREMTYENRLGESIPFWVLSDGGNFPVGSSWNAMIGAQWLHTSWLVDLELYHKKPTGIVEYAADRPGFQDANTFPGTTTNFRVFQGQGRIWGMDILARFQKKAWSSQLAYSLSKNEQQFAEVAQNSWFAAPDDRRHQFTWTTDYTWERWIFSASYVYNSGRPYTNTSLLNNNRDRVLLRPEERQTRLPAYNRIDVGVEWTFYLGNSKGSLGMSIFNLTDRENVAYRQYILSVPVERNGTVRNEVLGAQSGLLPRTFSINARWNWIE